MMLTEPHPIYCDHVIGFGEGQVFYCDELATHAHHEYWCENHCTGCRLQECSEIVYANGQSEDNNTPPGGGNEAG